MASDRGFPWRWLIAGLAVTVVVITLILPPPGSQDDNVGSDQDSISENVPEDSVEASVQDDTPAVSPDTVSVLVLNGTEINGLAGRTQRMLLSSSSDSTVILTPFDPSDTESKPYTETVVVSHLADLSSALFIADVLGLDEDSVIWEVPAGSAAPEVDVTVCLGEDIGSEIQ